MSTLIQSLSRENTSSWLLYFSDHGEDVYETIDMACHSEVLGTKPMYDVPFVLWKSPNHVNDSLVFISDRRFSTEDLIYTMADLAKIKFSELDKRRSIVNTAFEEKVLLLDGSVVYDSIFKVLK